MSGPGYKETVSRRVGIRTTEAAMYAFAAYGGGQLPGLAIAPNIMSLIGLISLQPVQETVKEHPASLDVQQILNEYATEPTPTLESWGRGAHTLYVQRVQDCCVLDDSTANFNSCHRNGFSTASHFCWINQ